MLTDILRPLSDPYMLQSMASPNGSMMLLNASPNHIFPNSCAVSYMISSILIQTYLVHTSISISAHFSKAKLPHTTLPLPNSMPHQICAALEECIVSAFDQHQIGMVRVLAMTWCSLRPWQIVLEWLGWMLLV